VYKPFRKIGYIKMEDHMTEEMAAQAPKADYIPGKSLEFAEETMVSFLKTADVTAVYGVPVEHGDTLIIPAAEVFAFVGFGAGEGAGSGPEGQGSGGGAGTGGGGRTFSRPVSVIIAGPNGVEVKHVLDITKIALAALTAWGFMGAMAFRMSRRRLR
jgi:uncharacterized spore protein YtfJ